MRRHLTASPSPIFPCEMRAMPQSRPPYFQHSQRFQRGLTLLEALVALAITALGLLGVAGVQIRTLGDTQNAVYRSQAIRLIEDLSERLRVQPNAMLQVNPTNGTPGYIQSSWGGTPSRAPTDCTATPCDASELAAYDLHAWHELVKETLPKGDAAVFLVQAEKSDNGNRRQLGVVLRWRKSERDGLSEDDKKTTDASLLKTARGFQSGSGLQELDKGCAAQGYVCHLQYITVAARCTPRKTAAGDTLHSCPL